ncbi:P-loop containing nucleoside triphosphate hydrolase protein [Rhizodiscina lignyota]|uniref:P-loop containing nucleoside triphosphate hydrolase protein n=1 Tax=Rhizodiscina lignyota TaxID=1504668 RepID=A0A9P4IMM4_9PEZI|nr:P-loop containing nucleoside triphosphate hydrolase protein [Rhizodiscina lignyota]
MTSTPDAVLATAHPAQPMLASTLLDIANTERRTRDKNRRRIDTGCHLINEALGGGFDYGRVNVVSGDGAVGKSTLSLQAVVSHILSSPSAQAAIIDTNGTFDVLRLHQAVLSCLKSRKTLGTSATSHENADGRSSELNVEEEAILDRVKIMRVFDLVGLAESVGEIRESFERRKQRAIAITEDESGPKNIANGNQDLPQKGAVAQKKLEIADSEDEDEDMLFTSTEPQETVGLDAQDTRCDKPQEQSKSQTSGHEEQMSVNDLETAPSKIGMIVIDNITQVLNPIMKANFVQAHAVMTPFLRHLTHLTRYHDICTILINKAYPARRGGNVITTAVGITETLPYSSPYDPAFNEPGPNTEVEPVSIFASNTSKPALGMTFAAYADLHILMSRVPKGKKDAQAVYGRKNGAGNAPAADFVSVVEVLSDRFDGRVGRWAPFRISPDGTIQDGV